MYSGVVLPSADHLHVPGRLTEHRLVRERHHVYRSGMVQLEFRVRRPEGPQAG
jgi:hypothetical protein